MAANVSGTVLASLFYDQNSCSGDQEGYLLGKIVNHVQDKISDSQISNAKVETIVYVYSYLPWPSEDKFYNAACRVNPTKAITLLKGRHQDLIGWYKFRRNSTLRPSLRECNLHNSLLESLPVEEHNNFLFFLCSASVSYNKATHTFDHVLLTQQNGKFQKVPMTVINLGDTTHTEYKQRGNMTVNPTGGSLHSVINQFQGDFVSEAGGMLEINKVRRLTATLHSKLQGLSSQVETSEVELSALEEEVKLMSYRMLEQEERRKEKKRAEEKPPPPQISMTLSPTLPDPPKLAAGMSERRLRVSGEGGRRARQISTDDDETVRAETLKRSPDVNLIDFEFSGERKIEESSSSAMELDSSESSDQAERTVPIHDKRPVQKISAKSDGKKSSNTGSRKPDDAFSFVSNMLEKEKDSTDNPKDKTEVGNSNNSAKRGQSRGETQTTRVRRTSSSEGTDRKRVASPVSRTRQPTTSQQSTSEVKGERSRPQRVRSRPVSGTTVRSRSRESPPGQKLSASNIANVNRTKSASPTNCRTPVRKTSYENGTDTSARMDDSKMSSSPVF